MSINNIIFKNLLLDNNTQEAIDNQEISKNNEINIIDVLNEDKINNTPKNVSNIFGTFDYNTLNDKSETDNDDFEIYDIKNIINRINLLSNKEKMHIFKILKSYNINCSQNANGYFFNLSNMEKDVIDNIYDCLILIEKNRDIIKIMNEKREKMLNHYKNLIEDQLKETIKQKIHIYKDNLILKKENYSIKANIKKKLKPKSLIYKKYKTIDPDELIKIHIKTLNNFQKDSVYHRIHTKIKNKNRKKNYEKIKESNEMDDTIVNFENEEFNEIDEIEDDYDNNSMMDIDDLPDEKLSADIKSKSEEHSDMSECEDNIEIGIEDIEGENDNLYYENENDNDNTNQEIDHESVLETDVNLTDIHTKDELDENKKEFENKLLFFKNLLHKKGFQFDENEKCLLVKQEYIA